MALLDAGNSLNEVGRRIGCNPSSVMRWREDRRWREAGALQVRFSQGRPTKLIVPQKKQLVRLLMKGAAAQGYGTNLWTTARIAELIEREFSVRYHPNHIGRLMHGLGWTAEKPKRRALERDAGKIEHRKQEDWPSIKNAARLGPHIAFVKIRDRHPLRYHPTAGLAIQRECLQGLRLAEMLKLASKSPTRLRPSDRRSQICDGSGRYLDFRIHLELKGLIGEVGTTTQI